VDQIKQDVMSILMALAETSDGLPIPRTMIYMALGCDLARYERAERFLIKARMVKATSETVRLTARGQETGDLINAKMGAA
jgi:hypothetical protein